ncbi:hypothetical protein AB9K26_01280 [Psychroserpens sp. XS_ASV72]|uniref:hypothetical protein n=1 Tax=Psychroserpens sp. XS_ASV72 TaxID=3241293 RepID=UPI0035136E4F
MKKSFLFISCEEAQHICDKSQYGEATFWERVKLSIRLSWCKVTQAYTKSNRKLTNAIKSSKVDCLKDSEMEALKTQFEEQLKKPH